MTKQEFLEQAHTAALQSSEKSGMPPMVTIAQAALESNWGQSKLSEQANNYFGIKAHAGHSSIVMTTTECEKGAQVVIKAEFAKYLSTLDCFRCRDEIIARGAVYAGRERSSQRRPDSSRRLPGIGPPIRSTQRS